ncbi:serine protease inhibitor dipetalogastin-like [Culicoides brevitarsis]|uniref:serine protease inhibitor dipetalogastin-like n=1 Tax=Culicoides brevitarsis TaxID=469753 RepID=UPI00307C4E3F
MKFFTVFLLFAMIFATTFACLCPANYTPVCGSDGETYANECALKCAQKSKVGLEVAQQGELKMKFFSVFLLFAMIFATTFACLCPQHYQPVCGSDGNTYGNECTLNCAQKSKVGLEVAKQGEC